MLKKFIFWSPLVVLLSIVLDAYIHYSDKDYLLMCTTAGIGWLLYWEALNDLAKQESKDV